MSTGPSPAEAERSRSTSPARAHYEARREVLGREIANLEAQSARISGLRGVTFLLAVALGGYAAFRPAPIAVALLAGASGAAFVLFVVRHALLLADKGRLEVRAAWIDRAIARMNEDVAKAPTGAAFLTTGHPYASDLDIVGRASLFQRVSTAETPAGQATLASWLLEPATPEVVLARQEAVRDLAERHAFREDLAALGFQVQVGRANSEALSPERLGAWARARATPPIRDRATAKLAHVIVPLTLASFAVAGPLASLFGPLRFLPGVLLVALVLILLDLRAHIEPDLALIASREAPFGRYRAVLERIEAEPWRAPRLALLARTLVAEGGATASREMRAFERIQGFADLRHNGLVHLFANFFLLWDVWCALALERWRERAGRSVEAWLAAMGEVEALASFATLHFEEPGYVFPELSNGPPCFEAKELAHPLLRRDVRIANDVAVGTAPAQALLVTGSNMSGKSTLLRAIGVNAVLALAGAPVCAASVRLTVLSVRTSMRISDSLEEGISHFYAELERLKAIVDAVASGARVLFLLDEVMHGTNSRERNIGAKAVIEHLVEKGAIGAATSHDLGLAALEEESGGRIRNAHFQEHVEDGRMTFDYRMRPGPVATTNALRLMRMVGLPVPESDVAP
jgi:ABC-type transport system involved in cytochrome c biogenesis ATPase subunit